ncbi:hypothetical protein HYPSUDRAFT_208516 [Hypholoma sublateritium FD-334 SS-4]|uniref:Uncharacterized protein n=1 Tax=Hypholoma sublateritium (strain FD-334 SS-4) TaxID=945553 RepID=A0A0D2KJ83_HYPSF|nr:hypothetical protein HYPSUDRAFT_208516 [Hypholoma sublateritium FD-334 SS-4]
MSSALGILERDKTQQAYPSSSRASSTKLGRTPANIISAANSSLPPIFSPQQTSQPLDSTMGIMQPHSAALTLSTSGASTRALLRQNTLRDDPAHIDLEGLMLDRNVRAPCDQLTKIEFSRILHNGHFLTPE